MARFRYTAFSQAGAPETGVLEAETEGGALERLVSLGLTVTELEPAAQRDGPGVLGRPPRLAEQADLAEQLNVLFAASLPAPKIVEIIAASNSNKTIQRHFHRMVQLMEDGMDFSQALSAASSSLSPLFSILASIGQKAGKPGLQMPQLAVALRRQQKLGAQIGGALVYPAILLCGGIAIVLMMALFLAPRLEVIFTSVNRPVPQAIDLFLTLGDWLSVIGVPLAVVAGLLAIWISRMLRKPSLRVRRVLQALPLVGQVFREASLARIVRAVQLMLDAGIPLPLALAEAARCYAAEPLSAPFRDAAAALEEGALASSVIAANPDLPPLFRELFEIGETTNALPKVLMSAATGLEDSVERRLQQLMTLLTPALTLVIGAVIAAIVASVMGAVLSVNDLAL